MNQSVAYAHGQGWMAALYDRTPVGAWYSCSNMPAEDYQRRFDENAAARRGLSYLDVKIDPAGVPRFTAVWDEASYTAYEARHAMTLEEDLPATGPAGLRGLVPVRLRGRRPILLT